MSATKEFTLDEVGTKTSEDAKYIVIHDLVYDVTKFMDEVCGSRVQYGVMFSAIISFLWAHFFSL